MCVVLFSYVYGDYRIAIWLFIVEAIERKVSRD